jgi:hypothetical protein
MYSGQIMLAHQGNWRTGPLTQTWDVRAEQRPVIVKDVVSRGGEKQTDAALSTKCPNRIVLKRLLDDQWWFASSQRAAPSPSYIPSL